LGQVEGVLALEVPGRDVVAQRIRDDGVADADDVRQLGLRRSELRVAADAYLLARLAALARCGVALRKL
jgi:hypothetical protein